MISFYDIQEQMHERTMTWDDYSGINFEDADLANVWLNGCDLRGADLSRCIIYPSTNFNDAIFDENTKMPDYPMACPAEGEFIGWKEL